LPARPDLRCAAEGVAAAAVVVAVAVGVGRLVGTVEALDESVVR
jgi:hypothetical protein